MAMRRRFNNRSRRPRRFGPKLHNVTRPGRWSVGNFYFSNSIDTDESGGAQTVMTTLAQMSHFGNTTPPSFLAVPEMARSLEIGGIVFHFTCMAFGPDAVEANPATLPEYWFSHNRLLLVTDRVDDGNVPTTILAPWFESTLPTVPIANLDNASENTDFPTRIHWQEGRTFQHGFATQLATGRPLAQAPVSNWTGTRSKRLKLRLTDEQGLYFVQTARTDTNIVGGDPVILYRYFSVFGTIYYRVKF